MENIDQINLLGTEITRNLSWNTNTAKIVKKVFGRLTLLRKLVGFETNDSDLVIIYILFVRFIVQFNCVVWHSSITDEERDDLERFKSVLLEYT